MSAPFPHCDSLVLHAPGECVYCDRYPDAQAKRVADGVNFTGEHDTSKAMCPAEARRALLKIERWGGNVPRKPGLFGSSVVPSIIRIGDRDVELGEIVREAHKRSFFSVQQLERPDAAHARVAHPQDDHRDAR
jgi:hypothetical protein